MTCAKETLALLNKISVPHRQGLEVRSLACSALGLTLSIPLSYFPAAAMSASHGVLIFLECSPSMDRA